MSGPTMRLVRERPAPPVLKLERRQSPRHYVAGQVTAIQIVEHDHHRQHRICPLHLRDLSDGGVGAVAQEPLEPGARMVVFFPPHGPEKGFDAYGNVVRCIPGETGHEVGIRFDPRPRASCA